MARPERFELRPPPSEGNQDRPRAAPPNLGANALQNLRIFLHRFGAARAVVMRFGDPSISMLQDGACEV